MTTMNLGFLRMLAALVVLASTTTAVNLPGVPNVFTEDKEVMSAIVDDIASKFEKEYLAYLRTGIESVTLKQLTTQLANSHSRKDIFTKPLSELDARDNFFSCTTCRASVNVFIRMIRDEDGELHNPDSEDLAKKYALDLCLRLNLQTEEVCNGLIQSTYKTFDYIARNSEIDSRSFCALFMGQSFCDNVQNPDYDWTLTIDKSVKVSGPKKDTPKHTENDLKLCHITDIHLDPLYQPGSLAECDEPLCCQREKSDYEGSSKAAGYWGDYRECDLPWHSFENAMQHLVSSHKCDLVIQTGDIIDHMVWATSIEKNSEWLSKVNNHLAEVFVDVPVYPCIGNHEPHPLNLFSPNDVPEEINTKWLYEHLYNDWSKWLPASTKETILDGGYYTVVPKKGYRIIALNSNDCYTTNFWLYHSGTNKQPQLQWLHDTLLQAEKDGEYCHIITHIPSGDGTCWAVWAREYNRVIDRFRDTISGIFNGHSHNDEFSVHYSSDGNATAVEWNGGSLTTFTYKNPNYRVYDIDPQVTNHHTYIYNLTEANLNPDREPEWFEEYEFIKEFTEDTSPHGIDQLLDDFADNPDLLRKYWRFKYTSSSPRIDGGCDATCLQKALCRTATTVNTDTIRCEELKERLTIALDKENASSTTQYPPTTKEPGGAASLTAMSISGLTVILLAMKVFI